MDAKKIGELFYEIDKLCWNYKIVSDKSKKEKLHYILHAFGITNNEFRSAEVMILKGTSLEDVLVKGIDKLKVEIEKINSESRV